MEEGNKYIMQCSPAESNSVEKMARKKGSNWVEKRVLVGAQMVGPHEVVLHWLKWHQHLYLMPVMKMCQKFSIQLYKKPH